MHRSVIAALVCTFVTVRAQVTPGEQTTPVQDRDPTEPEPDAGEPDPPAHVPSDLEPALEAAPPHTPSQSAPASAPIADEHLTTSARWRPRFHFDMHWRVLMLPERIVELAFLPISLVVGAVEEYRLDKRVADLLSFRDGRFKLSPRFKFSLGDGAGLGIWFRRGKIFARRAEMRVGSIIRFDGDWQAELEYKHALLLPGGRGLRTRAYVEDDRNQRFYGIGGDSAVSDRRVLRSFEQGALVEIDLQGIDRYTYSGTAKLGLRRQLLSPGTSSTIPAVGESGDAVMPPPGFDDTALYVDARIDGRYDTRDTFGRPTRGLLIELEALARNEVSGKDLSAVTFAGSARWHLPVLPDRRVLVFTIAGAAAVPLLPGSTIPLESLAVLGRGNVRGYDRERFRDRYALVGSVEYRFPIYEYLRSQAGLDAFTFVDTGTIWGAAPWGSSPVRWSAGGGVRGAHETTLVFETTIGYSPEGFELTIGAESTL